MTAKMTTFYLTKNLEKGKKNVGFKKKKFHNFLTKQSMIGEEKIVFLYVSNC